MKSVQSRSWTTLLLLLVPPTLFAQGIRADDTRLLTTTLGSSGLGIELSQPLTQRLRVRGVLSALEITMTGLESLVGTREAHSGIDYEFTVSGYNFGALLDFHPGNGGFRASFGLLLTNPKLEFESLDAQGEYRVGNTTYISDDLYITGETESNKMAPYLGIGWVSSSAKKGFHFQADIGVTYIGDPTLRLAATGTAREQGNDDAAEINIGASSDFLADLEIERRDLEQDISEYEIWPMINLGLGYRF